MSLKNEDIVNRITTKVENNLITFNEFTNYHNTFIDLVTLHTNRELVRKYAETLSTARVECKNSEEEKETLKYKDALKSVLNLPKNGYGDEDLVNIYKVIAENVISTNDIKGIKK